METIIGNEFAEKVIPLIKRAIKNIDIIVFAWCWYQDQIGSNIQKFNNAIIDARKRGVNIKVLTDNFDTLKILSENKVEAKRLETKRTVHAKLIIIDNETVILGSHNYTMAALTTNYEISIATQEKKIVKRLTNYFNYLWQY